MEIKLFVNFSYFYFIFHYISFFPFHKYVFIILNSFMYKQVIQTSMFSMGINYFCYSNAVYIFPHVLHILSFPLSHSGDTEKPSLCYNEKHEWEMKTNCNSLKWIYPFLCELTAIETSSFLLTIAPCICQRITYSNHCTLCEYRV